MKNKYFAPLAEVVALGEELMQVPLESVGESGRVEDSTGAEVDGTNWKFGGNGRGGDTPDAKSGNLWDNWDD